jgi:hypothetical protein
MMLGMVDIGAPARAGRAVPGPPFAVVALPRSGIVEDLGDLLAIERVDMLLRRDEYAHGAEAAR